MNIQFLPANIYKTYCEYTNEKSYSRKLQLMFDVFGQVIRFFGCVFLSEYMYSDLSDAKVNDSIIGLARPSLGTWFAFVREYAKLIYKTKDSFINEVGDCFIDIYQYKKYEKEYIGRFRNPASSKDNAFNELIALRNAIAHGAMAPEEEEAKEITGIYDQYIEKILEVFSVIFEKYTVAKVDEVRDDFVSIAVFYDLIRFDDKFNDRIMMEYPEDQEIMGVPASEYFKEGQMYLLSKDGRVLKLAEFLIEIIDDTEHEDYYLYDGYRNKDVVYIGMKTKKLIDQYLSSIKNKFREKGAGTKWKKTVFDFDSFTEYLNELASVSIHIHEKTGKYNGKVYVERECDCLLDDFLSSDKTTMIVSAEAGVGKTNFLCHSARKLIRKNNAVYFFNGNTLTETQSDNILFHRIQEECLSNEDFRTTFDFLEFIDQKNSNKTPLVLIVDAANEAYDMLGVLQEIDTITSKGDVFPWLKIIVSIRKVSFEILINRITDEYGKKLPFYTDRNRFYSVVKDNTVTYEVEIEEWNIVQVTDAFEKYKKGLNLREDSLVFHTMNRNLQTLLHNPLNMGLFFWAQKEMPDVTVETEEDLYRIMENESGSEITQSLLILQNSIVKEMINQKKNELDADVVHIMNDEVTSDIISDIRIILLSPLERLKDAGILFEKEENERFIISFVYQKYLEYEISKRYLSEITDSSLLIHQMLDSKDWQELPEMYMACLNSLEKIQDNTAASLYYTAKERGIDAKEIKTAVVKLWKKRTLSGYGSEVVTLITDESLYDWGLELANDLYINEESTACYQLVNDLLKKETPIDGDLYYQRGLYYMKVSKLDKAEKDFITCIDISDGDLKIKSIIQLAKNHRKKGEVPRAIEILDSFLMKNNEETYCYADALIQRGLCSYSNHKLEEALDYYERALTISKRNKDHYVTVYNMLGMSTVHAQMGHLDECEDILMDVLKMSSELGYVDHLADCLNGLSANYVRKKEYNKSLSYAKQGLAIWEYSDFYTGQVVMFCTIIKSLIGLGKIESIAKYRSRLEETIPMIKERVILDLYDETKHLLKNMALD